MTIATETILTEQRTIRDVVVEDYRTAAVFQKYDLDFCCGGGVSIERACEKKGIDVSALLSDLKSTLAEPSAGDSRMNAWSAPLLIDYIEENHHAWVRSVVPAVRQHAEKVARVHGPGRPSLVEVNERFQRMADELEAHMQAEEKKLFPLIRRLTVPQDDTAELKEKVKGIIDKMERDHTEAGDDMREIRRLTDDFTPPSDACMTYKVLFQELKDFETDLHRHVHLENNLLHQKVLKSITS